MALQFGGDVEEAKDAVESLANKIGKFKLKTAADSTRLHSGASTPHRPQKKRKYADITGQRKLILLDAPQY